jgi:dihydroorotate dehydrogenase
VKIAPDLSSNELDAVIAACEHNEVAGIIATNTMLDHSAIPLSHDQSGGLSGAPLREKSTTLIRDIVRRSRIPVIGVGGVFDGESALEKIEAGAQLLQVYTGYIYRGPQLLAEIMETVS